MNALAFLRDAAGIFLLASGLAFTALGIFGLFRMPDCYTRMHASSKAVALGAPMLLLGITLLAPLSLGVRAIAVMAFIVLTTPVSIFLTARAAHRRREPMTARTVIDELEEMRRSDRAADREPYPID